MALLSKRPPAGHVGFVVVASLITWASPTQDLDCTTVQFSSEVDILPFAPALVWFETDFKQP